MSTIEQSEACDRVIGLEGRTRRREKAKRTEGQISPGVDLIFALPETLQSVEELNVAVSVIMASKVLEDRENGESQGKVSSIFG